MKYYHYLFDDTVIRVKASRRPGPDYKRGSWVVQERAAGSWVMPGFPEITWGTLAKLEYLGAVLITSES